METLDVKLPSGLVVTIKKPGPLALRSLYGSLPILPAEMEATSTTDDPRLKDQGFQIDAAIKLVCACSVKPRLSEPPLADGEMSIDDLSIDDFSKLAEAVNSFSGLTQLGDKTGPLSETVTP